MHDTFGRILYLTVSCVHLGMGYKEFNTTFLDSMYPPVVQLLLGLEDAVRLHGLDQGLGPQHVRLCRLRKRDGRRHPQVRPLLLRVPPRPGGGGDGRPGAAVGRGGRRPHGGTVNRNRFFLQTTRVKPNTTIF